MHTKCPNCKALFRLNVKQFQQAKGRVRCGQCRTQFDAQINIVLPKAGEVLNGLETITGQETRSRENLSVTTRHMPNKTPGQEHEEIPIPKLIAESSGDTPRHSPAAKRTIAFSNEGKAEKPQTSLASQTIWSPHLSTLMLGLGCITLAVLLSAQFLYFHRDLLGQQPFLASIIEDVCDTVGCEIEPLRDVDRIEIINRNVFSHPNVADALMITATFANVAPFPQPYPVMQVSLTDLQGRTVATRRFSPREYLNNAGKSATLMKPGVPVDVNVEVQDPQNGAMAFEFAFFDLQA